jgi:hypothetical protein
MLEKLDRPGQIARLLAVEEDTSDAVDDHASHRRGEGDTNSSDSV